MNIVWGIGYGLFMIIHAIMIIADKEYQQGLASKLYSILIPIILLAYIVLR